MKTINAQSIINGDTSMGCVNSYATDGKCHNAQIGTYGHECGKPASWIGTTSTGFSSGFCSECKESGDEARTVMQWDRIPPVAASSGMDTPR